MSKTVRRCIVGRRPPCYIPSRLEERSAKARQLRQERRRKPDKPDDFVTYEDSDSEDETPVQQNEVLNTSYNFVDYVRSRELNIREQRSVCNSYASRHILTHDMFKETAISLGNINKVFCSQWLSNRQIIFGTKCNKLMVYDVNMRRVDAIPTLQGSRQAGAETQNGINAIEINPSRTLLATTARHSADIAVYRLPTLDPVYIGEYCHRDWVMDMCWLDDQFLVSGSKDAKMALWRINEDENKAEVNEKTDEETCPTPDRITAFSVKECRAAQKIRALCFNPDYKEIAVISLNGYIHIFNAETFSQKLSRKLPNCQDNVCIASQPQGLYAVGCRSYTLLLDPRTLQAVKKIASRYSGCGIRSASFQENILTVGTGLGMLMFYDLRAGKYLESSINSSRTVVLKASKGYVFPEEDIEGFQQVRYVPAIYTHCYEPMSGTRLFAAGGPLPATLVGNYAGIWQ